MSGIKSDPWEDAMMEVPVTKTSLKIAPAPASAATAAPVQKGMVWTSGGWRPAEVKSSAPAPTAAETTSSKSKPTAAKHAEPLPAVSAAYARSMVSLNVNIVETIARDSHGARDLSAERDAVVWGQIAKQLKEQEKQDKMAKFNGYAAKGGGYVRR